MTENAVRERAHRAFAVELQRFLEGIGEDHVFVARKLGVPLIRAQGLCNGTVFANESEAAAIRRLVDGGA